MKLTRIEDVIIKTDDKEVKLKAKVDTGADRTSIDKSLIEKLNLNVLDKSKNYKSSNGCSKRRLVRFSYSLKGKIIQTTANITDRSMMKYKMIIGCNDLNGCEVII